ncbi:MAG: leucyl aminopeptidase family protein [Oligoflexales bacterium]|nr:leucyl aminopeptidase family protein [Oligoflexales bacterium]
MKRTKHKKNNKNGSIFGWTFDSFIDLSLLKKSPAKGKSGTLYFFGSGYDKKNVSALIKNEVRDWELSYVRQSDQESYHLSAQKGPLWLLFPKNNNQNGKSASEEDFFKPTPYAKARDLAGSIIPRIDSNKVENLEIIFEQAKDEEIYGALTGIEIGLYSFNKARAKEKNAPKSVNLYFPNTKRNLIEEAVLTGQSVNLVRHLVNVPPNELNPATFTSTIKSFFGGKHGTTIEIWDRKRLEKEGMGLILGVGQGSENPPCLVHIRYRPAKTSKGIKKPYAFVGKGITFDTGGLNIKPSTSMKLMKKDMGGSATLLGLLYWLIETKSQIPVDIYLPLAENSVDKNAIRPSDILTSRSGQSVEIQNTDAEGRLLLADAIDVAIKQKGDDEPSAIIDIATLTGAARVALGIEIANLFTNNDKLCDRMLKAGRKMGDFAWRMPLYQPYAAHLKSSVADIGNSGSSPYAGAITAALFLHKFIQDKPWAHFDIMAWSESPAGAINEAGANGQIVQLIIEFIKSL